MRTIRPKIAILSGAVVGLVAGLAVYGAVSTNTAATPRPPARVAMAGTANLAIAPVKAPVKAHCAKGTKLRHGACIEHVTRVVHVERVIHIRAAQPVTQAPPAQPVTQTRPAQPVAQTRPAADRSSSPGSGADNSPTRVHLTTARVHPTTARAHLATARVHPTTVRVHPRPARVHPTTAPRSEPAEADHENASAAGGDD